VLTAQLGWLQQLQCEKQNPQDNECTNVWWLLLLKMNHMDHMDAEDKSYG